MHRLKFLAACAALSVCASTWAQQGASKGEWRFWGGDAGSTRYSASSQIDATNARTLEVAWRWKSLAVGTKADANLQATPLYVNGLLYTSTGAHQVAAIDPATGGTVWVFTPSPSDVGGRTGNPSGRGLAYWTDGKRSRLFRNTLDGRLISIDVDTGRADPNFGPHGNGSVLLKQDLVEREVGGVGSTSPAIVVGNVVVVQVVAEVAAANKESIPGFIRGYDVRSGKLLWTFRTVPQKGEYGVESWQRNSWQYTGNTGVWTLMSADEQLGYVYLPVESASHDFYGGHRLGDNLFAESLVCLDAKTGKRVWHYQVVHHGVWDYDLPAAPILSDIKVGNRKIRAVTLLTKQGLAFVFDRRTGKPVWPIEERAVPASDVPGEQLAPTQPFPTKPAPYETLGYHEADLIDFTPELRAEALAIAQRYVRGPMYTPPTRVVPGGTQGTWVSPGYGGGSNWNGAAFDPETGLLFVPTKTQPMIAALTPADAKLTNFDYVRAPTASVQGPRGLPITRPPWSRITATDLNRGEHVWVKPIGAAPPSVSQHPALQGLGLDFSNMGQPLIRPSPLVTKTLLFMGESGALSGDPGGPLFRAYDKRSGAVVAEVELPAKSTGAPMTYTHRGKQYIVIAVGARDFPSELVALSLPTPGVTRSVSVTAAPTSTPVTAPVNAVPVMGGDAGKGREVYATFCAACHGPRGAGIEGSGPTLAGQGDLAKLVQKIRQGGAEMPPMQTMLSAEQISDVSRFVAAGLPAP